ncbi:MAG: hypothetical protein E6713_17845 [Sporomusaceae bacterium]|nr:hypothetical protein [Sporomusaceae bacterium]
MKRFLAILLFAMIICQVAYAAEPTWQYVTTQNNVSYHVDMNRITINKNILNFWLLVDRKTQQQTVKAHVTADLEQKIYRFDEAYITDTASDQTAHMVTPTPWEKITPASPIEKTIQFIMTRHNE